jgi:outer membrane murein-binding lipoprotein Lpp
MMVGARGYEITRIGELSLAQNVARELAANIDELEEKLENIASAIYGMDKPTE